MDCSNDQIGFISWNQHCMKFYFRILILFAVGQMQSRLAQLIHFGYAPAEHPVSTKWLSVCLSLSAQLNPSDSLLLCIRASWPGGQVSHKERTCIPTFLFQDFFLCFRARPVTTGAEWHRHGWPCWWAWCPQLIPARPLLCLDELLGAGVKLHAQPGLQLGGALFWGEIVDFIPLHKS